MEKDIRINIYGSGVFKLYLAGKSRRKERKYKKTKGR